MKRVKKLYGLVMTFSLPIIMASCNERDSQRKIGGSQDTSSVNRAGGPAIRDTATINKDRRDSARRPAGDSISKGNADPSGHTSGSPVKH
ncbi:hypothetical protein [Mucilaginibacter sp.]|jgi:hypothetical protein|uniref:hypothetical protein n=1 Tax=Mucilaginibacter sp. TaxID=1882438 RepID=UPI002ED4F78C